MARVKIKVERGNGLQQVVVVDTEATKGATIGTNVYNADGTLYVPASGGSGANIRNGYGILISGTNPKTINVNRAANFDWQGQHQWEKPLWMPDGTAALPAATFTSDPNTGAYRVGADNYGIATNGVLRWDVNTARVYQNVPLTIDCGNGLGLWVRNVDATIPGGVQISTNDTAGGGVSNTLAFVGNTVIPTGFRFYHDETLTVTPGAYLSLYRMTNAGTQFEVFRVPRDVETGIDFIEQARGMAGSASAPSWSFTGDPNTGVFNSGADEVGLATGGTLRVRLTTTTLNTSVQVGGPAGTAADPTFRFTASLSAGLYLVGTNNPGISTNGTLRWDINTTRINTTLPMQGPAGSAGTPTYSASGDPNTGVYLPGSDVLAFATAGTLRYQFGAAGQFGIGGATYGTANTQAIVSGGASAAPSWQTVCVDGQAQTLGGAKTWSAQQTFSVGPHITGAIAALGASRLTLDYSGGGRIISWGANTSTISGFELNSRSSDNSVIKNSLLINTSGGAISGQEYGNSTDNPPHTFYGNMIFNSLSATAVSLGDPDSGGTGYRCLRVPN